MPDVHGDGLAIDAPITDGEAAPVRAAHQQIRRPGKLLPPEQTPLVGIAQQLRMERTAHLLGRGAQRGGEAVPSGGGDGGGGGRGGDAWPAPCWSKPSSDRIYKNRVGTVVGIPLLTSPLTKYLKVTRA